MNKATIYAIEEFNEEFYKVKNYGRYDYPVDMWLVGSAIDKANGCTIVYKDSSGIYGSLEAAREDFKQYYNFSYLQELSASGRDYMRVCDYCITEYIYDLDAIKEDHENINDVVDLMKALNDNPWDYGEYECVDSNDVIDISNRKYTAWVKYESEGKTVTIEEEFTTVGAISSYNAYLEAKEWMDNQWDKLVEKEDNDEGIYTVDCGVWY